MLEKTGDFQVTLSDRLDDLKPESIKKYDIVLFYGSGGNFTDEAQEQGVEQFVQGGGGLAGVHATDAFKQSDVYWRLFGGRFIGHGGGSFMMRIENKEHPIAATMEDFEIQDETYRDKYHPEFKLHSLGHIDRGAEQQSMIWVQEFGKGRVFNTTLATEKRRGTIRSSKSWSFADSIGPPAGSRRIRRRSDCATKGTCENGGPRGPHR